MTESTARYTSFRIALASGLLGAAGATLGWLAWLTVRVANPELLFTVLVGASLGLTVHWIQHYVRVARRERDGSVPVLSGAAPPPTIRSRAAFTWAAGFGFLGLVTEHLVADMAAEFLQPFLASIATLLPAGMILGWTMSHGRLKRVNLFLDVMGGLGVGIAIALVTGLIWSVGFGSVPWKPLLSWWGLIGLGSRLVVRSERNSVRIVDPLIAVALVFVGSLLINKLPPSSYEFFGPWRGIPLAIRLMSAEIHDSPALPATFWIDAEKRMINKERGVECPEPRFAVPPPAPIPVAKDTMPPRPISSDPLQAAIDQAAQPAVPDSIIVVETEPKPGALTEFLRSWLVILLFATGIGIAPTLERALRPIDYPNSETYRRDITLTVVVVLMLVGACVYARMDQRKDAARIEACVMKSLQRDNERR